MTCDSSVDYEGFFIVSGTQTHISYYYTSGVTLENKTFIHLFINI